MPARPIAIVTSNYSPEPTGISQVAGEFARYLAASGLSVRVATALPFYPKWAVWPEYRGRFWLSEELEGVIVYRSWHFVRPAPSTLVRLLHETTLSLMALPNLIRALWGAQRAYLITPALSFAYTGAVIARLLGVPRVVVVMDVQPDAAIELGMMRNRLLIWASRWLARQLYAHAEEIHTLGEGMRARIAATAPKQVSVRIVPVTVDPVELEPVAPPVNLFRHRFLREGQFAVLHTGNMGRKQDLGLVLATADLLRADPGVRFLVFGDGAERERFLAERSRRSLEQVEHHPLQPRDMLRHMLSGADLVLVSQLPEVVDIVFPSKLVTSLAAGALVVVAAAAQSEAARVVREHNLGLTTPPSDPNALMQLIAELRSGNVDTDGYRKRARAYAVRTFDRDAVYGPIVASLRSA